MTDGKTCPRCTTYKLWDDYHISRTVKSGHQTYCKTCAADIQREYLERNKEAVALRREARTVELLRSPTTGKKTCTKCGELKPLLEFYQHRSTRDGRFPSCKECAKTDSRARHITNREKNLVAMSARYHENKGEYSAGMRHWRMNMYGLTVEKYEEMARAQDYKCAICLLPERYIDPRTNTPRRLAVDHDHKTLRVRGLLCGRCNRSIGQFADDHDRLNRAAEYLRAAAIE